MGLYIFYTNTPYPISLKMLNLEFLRLQGPLGRAIIPIELIWRGNLEFQLIDDAVVFMVVFMVASPIRPLLATTRH